MADTGSTQQGRVGADGTFTAAKLNAIGGVDSASFDGSGNVSEIVTIVHGLGYKPTSVAASPVLHEPGFGIVVSTPYTVATGNYTDTTFDAQVTDNSGTPPGGQIVDFNWIAI